MVSRLPPDLDDLDALARTARAAMPDPFRTRCAEVALRVVEMPEEAMCADLGIDDPWSLTGLYDGVPLPEKSSLDQAVQPDTVWLFRLPILLEWIERGDIALEALVTHVLVHEYAHHLGWSDADIAAIDPWWE
ncbi:MAG: metallopeptidase family protein [Pseudomonadota bacterium]